MHIAVNRIALSDIPIEKNVFDEVSDLEVLTTSPEVLF